MAPLKSNTQIKNRVDDSVPQRKRRGEEKRTRTRETGDGEGGVHG